MDLNLNVWQRMVLVMMLNTTRGDLRTVRMALKALEILELSVEEKIAVGYTEPAPGNAQWRDREARFELRLPEEVGKWLKRTAKERQDWPVNPNMVDLMAQLGLGEDD